MRLNKVFQLLLLFLLIIFMTLTLFLFWAVGPAVAPKTFPAQGIVEIPLSNERSPKDSQETLVVVSYNMGYASGAKNNQGAVLTQKEVAENLSQMVKALEELSPDIMLLQEVDFKAHRSFGIDQMEVLARALGLPHASYAITWNHRYLPWPYWPVSKHFGSIFSGQAILSRYPIKQQKILRFEKPQENYFWYNWFYINRLVQKVEVAWNEKSLTIFNAHLEAFSEPTRQQQIKRLAQWIQETKPGAEGILVGGDFNAVWKGRGEDPQEDKRDQNNILQFQNLTQLKLARAEDTPLTFPSWEPKKAIDFIFYAKNFRLLAGGVLSKIETSDHLPVWGKFILSADEKTD